MLGGGERSGAREMSKGEVEEGGGNVEGRPEAAETSAHFSVVFLDSC